jgi:ATP phosphoribosyltransferase regulatory subunit
MEISKCVWRKSERTVFALRELYASHGFGYYRMSKFEEYDLYARNKEFLVSDNVITFTDTGGRLMALKPDVTLSIIKNSPDEPDRTARVCYNENVYRVDEGSGSFRESMQCGLECFGRVTAADAAEVILLAAESLSGLSDRWELSISDLGLLEGVLAGSGVPADYGARMLKAAGENNIHELESLGAECGCPGAAEGLAELLACSGPFRESAARLTGRSAELDRVAGAVGASPLADRIRLDFTVTADINYYNGLIFKGFIDGVPGEVLSGGMYSSLMRKLRRRSDAIGFAVYTDKLDRESDTREGRGTDGFVNVALPKGRLGDQVYALFAEAGFDCPSILENNRRLVFENEEKKLRFFWVKPSDVAIYVERGAADIGVAGKDILLEYAPDVYELLDLGAGRCFMAVAAPRGYRDDKSGTLRVATKFSNIARNHFGSVGRDIDIIHLNGSIELAPLLGLSDVIVDIVETGTTLRENDLEVTEKIVPISARLIANKAAFKFKREAVEKIAAGLRAAVGNGERK